MLIFSLANPVRAQQNQPTEKDLDRAISAIKIGMASGLASGLFSAGGFFAILKAGNFHRAALNQIDTAAIQIKFISRNNPTIQKNLVELIKSSVGRKGQRSKVTYFIDAIGKNSSISEIFLGLQDLSTEENIGMAVVKYKNSLRQARLYFAENYATYYQVLFATDQARFDALIKKSFTDILSREEIEEFRIIESKIDTLMDKLIQKSQISGTKKTVLDIWMENAHGLDSYFENRHNSISESIKQFVISNRKLGSEVWNQIQIQSHNKVPFFIVEKDQQLIEQSSMNIRAIEKKAKFYKGVAGVTFAIGIVAFLVTVGVCIYTQNEVAHVLYETNPWNMDSAQLREHLRKNPKDTYALIKLGDELARSKSTLANLQGM